MKSPKLLPLLAACVAVATVGCTAMPTPLATTPTGQTTNLESASNAFMPHGVLLQGRVEFPREDGYVLKATEVEVGARATVSLIEPSTGSVLAGGVTDAKGNFRIFQSEEVFIPSPDTVYTLEISKRVDGQDGDLLTLRTYLVWKATQSDEYALAAKTVPGGQEPDSITGPEVLVNLTTTAIVQITIDDDDVLPSDVMGVAPGGQVRQPFGHLEASYDDLLDFDDIDFGALSDDEIDIDPGFIGQSYGAQEVAELAAGLRSRLHAGLDPAVKSNGIVHPGNFEVLTLADLDRLAHLSEIGGDLIINFPPAVDTDEDVYDEDADLHKAYDLSAPLLRRIGGNFLIGNAGSLKSLRGMGALKEVNGSFGVIGTSRLRDFQGLEGLIRVGDNLLIEQNAALKSLRGLDNLQRVKTLDIKHNHELLTLGGEVNPRLAVQFGVRKPAGLESLAEVEEISVWGNERLVSARAITLPRQVKGKIEISGNPLLEMLPALGRVEYLESDLTITGNQSLRSLEGVSHLKLVPNMPQLVDISHNRKLSQFCVDALLEQLGGASQTGKGNDELSQECEIVPDDIPTEEPVIDTPAE